MPTPKLLQPYLRNWLNWVLEFPCPLCHRSTANDWCLDCQRQVQRCQFAKSERLQSGQPTVFAWGRYGGRLKQAIAALKYGQQPHLARPLADWLATAWLEYHSDLNCTVVPIPMHASKRQERGFNQAELLAEHFCQYTRLKLVRTGLERIKATNAQFQLSAADRAHNLSAAFTLGPEFRRTVPVHPVLLLDDIYTTGATVRSAAQTLRQQGIRVYGVVVVARAEKQKD